MFFWSHRKGKIGTGQLRGEVGREDQVARAQYMFIGSARGREGAEEGIERKQKEGGGGRKVEGLGG